MYYTDRKPSSCYHFFPLGMGMARPKSQEAHSSNSVYTLGAHTLAVSSLVVVFLLTGCSGDKEGTKSSSGKSKSGSLTSSALSSGSSTGSSGSSTGSSGSSDSSTGSSTDSANSSNSAGTTRGGNVGTVPPATPTGKNPLLTGDPAKYKMAPRTDEERKAIEILKTLEPLVTAGKVAEAQEQAEKASKMAPDYPPVWNAVGVLSGETDKKTAFAALRRAVELDPYYYTAWGNLGVLYQRDDRPGEAMNIFKHMTQLAPNSSKVWVSYGEMCLERNRVLEAEDAFNRAIEVDPKSCGGWYMLGYLYHGTQRPVEAEKYYKKAIALEPKIVDAYLHLGVLYRSQKRLKEAETILRKLTQVSPDYRPGFINLASVLQERGDTKGAQKVLAQGNKLNPPKKEELLCDQAGRSLAKDEYAEARKYALEARRINSKWYRPWYMLGKIALEENKLDEAIQYLQGSIKCNKSFTDAYNSLGCALAYQGKMLEARKAFEKCIELEPNSPMFLANLSECMRETSDDKRKARLLAKRAEQLDARLSPTGAPRDPHVIANAAKFLLVDGLYDEAITKLNYAIKIDPNYTTSWNYLGLCYAQKKDGNKALECFKKAVAADKNNTEAWKNLAELYRLAGDKKAEAQALKNSLNAHSGTTAEGLYSVAYKLEKLGQKSSASAALKQGLDMDPAEADVLLNVPYVEDQHKDEAIFGAPPDLLRKRVPSD